MIYTDEYGRIRSDKNNGLDYKPYRPSHPSKSIDYNGKNIQNNIHIFPQHKVERDSYLYQTICDCQECHNILLFYCKCKNGGRVFFESLSPSWKKHECPCYSNNLDIEKDILESNLYKNLYPHSYDYKSKQKKLIFKNNEGLSDFDILVKKNSFLYIKLIEDLTLLYRIEKDIIMVNILSKDNKLLYKDKKFKSVGDLKSFLTKEFSRQANKKSKFHKSKKNTMNNNSFHNPFKDYFSSV